MATALVDLYGGEDFEPFDRIILPEAYRPSEAEEFMCGKHRAYFLRKLKGWKEAIVEESRATMAQLQVDSLREPDLADRASSETDWSIELRTRDLGWTRELQDSSSLKPARPRRSTVIAVEAGAHR